MNIKKVYLTSHLNGKRTLVMFAFLFLFAVKNHAQDHTIEDRLAKLEQSLQDKLVAELIIRF